MTTLGSQHVESGLYGSIQLFDLLGVARAHKPSQSLARNREEVVEVRDAWSGQSLPTTEHHLCRYLAHGPGYEDHNDSADTRENRIESRVRITTGRSPTGSGNAAHQTSPRFTLREDSTQVRWVAR